MLKVLLKFDSRGDDEQWVYCNGIQLGHMNNWKVTLSVTIPHICKVYKVTLSVTIPHTCKVCKVTLSVTIPPIYKVCKVTLCFTIPRIYKVNILV